MTRGEWLFRDLRELWADLDSYAVHRAGCPAATEPEGECTCDRSDTRLRLREVAWAVSIHFGAHTNECRVHGGQKCNCGLANARRRLEAVLVSGKWAERFRPLDE